MDGGKLTEEVKKRMEELISMLEQWLFERYQLHYSSVSLEIYDQHFQELSKLEQQHNFILPNSPTLKVGLKLSENVDKVHRKVPMLSLDSVYEHQDLEKWETKIKKILKIDKIVGGYLCEYKIDGLSLSLLYKNNQLVQMSTRGDGYEGENVTPAIKLIRNVPLTVSELDDFEVRGEVFMAKDDFLDLNKELVNNGERELSSPRNAAAGTIQTLIAPMGRKLLFFAYRLFGSFFASQEDCLKKLIALGFNVSPYKMCNNLIEVRQFIEKAIEHRCEINFETDGIVIKLNNYDCYEALGNTNRSPRWAIAYKYPPSTIYSRILNIVTMINRTGKASYVALVNPVLLQGSLIKKITLHNYLFIKNTKIAIGDEVVIKKSGDVIPQIVKTIKLGEGVWEPSVICPSCGKKLVWNESGIYQICFNVFCPQRIISNLVHFSSKNGLGIEGVSYAMIKKLFEVGLLKEPTDFYTLLDKKNFLFELKGLKRKKIDNILLAIENSKKQPFFRLLCALSIPLLSIVKARNIAKVYSGLSEFINALENDEWMFIKQVIGGKSQQEIEKFWRNTDKKKILLSLKDIFNE